MVVDYSQYSLFQFCPWAWYEKYVRGMARRYDGQRDDALTLGSLTHNGLDNFTKYGKPEVDDATITETNPTPECLTLARQLIEGYVQKFPSERWVVEATEQPLKFSLTYGDAADDSKDIEAVAKLDGYFYVPEDTTIESGLPGDTLTLSRGWWAREYKTKSPAVDRSSWIKEWQTKMQASFQILALQHFIHNESRDWGPEGRDDTTVQGVLVCVLEKPRKRKAPERKCAGCEQMWELASYIPHAEGHSCPYCGTVQKLNPYKPRGPEPKPEYFRITITREPWQLETAREEIAAVAMEMQNYRNLPMPALVPDRDNCVNNRHHTQCEFFHPHTYGNPVEPGMDFVQIDPYKYIGLQEARA